LAHWFSQTIERFRPRQSAVEDARAPEGLTLYAIGDIHGRADLLQRLLSQIEEDLHVDDGPAEIVFLGDYVDRGPDSRKVLELLIDLKSRAGAGVTVLRGNHEEALLGFLADPTTGAAWAEHGGLQTLQSYGVSLTAGAGATEWAAARDAFDRALPADHLGFLEGLELWAERGDYIFVHAGVRPGVPMDAQEAKDLLWIRSGFLDHDTQLDRIVVHGHTPDEIPAVTPFRIGVDTGAYATGVLTALRLKGAARTFLQTRA
jgi:serine/threonine protein phosphatase 1